MARELVSSWGLPSTSSSRAGRDKVGCCLARSCDERKAARVVVSSYNGTPARSATIMMKSEWELPRPVV